MLWDALYNNYFKLLFNLHVCKRITDLCYTGNERNCQNLLRLQISFSKFKESDVTINGGKCHN